MELLTASRLRSFRTCQRQHFLAYVEGYRPTREAPALAFGTAIHKALEAYWLSRKDGAERDPFVELPDDLDPFTRAKAEAMLAAYIESWDAIRVEVLHVEVEFEHPLINPETGYPSRTWRAAGKMDAVVRLSDGRVAVIEHKTTSENPAPGSAYRLRLMLDGQVSQYVQGAEALELKADLVIYDVLRKPDLDPLEATPEEQRQYTQPKSRQCAVCRKKNAPPGPHRDEAAGTGCVDGRVITDPGGRLYANQRERDETVEEYRDRCIEKIAAEPEKYLSRVPVVRLESERREYQFDIWQWAGLMRESVNANIAPKNPDACHRFGTPCQFWEVCTGQASLEDSSRFVRVENVNQELHPKPQAA
jgi:hypothetical protein